MHNKKSLLWSACLAATMSMGFSAGSNAGVWLDVEGKDIGELAHRIERIHELNEESKTNPWMGVRLNLTWSEIPMAVKPWSASERGRLQYDFSQLKSHLDEIEAAGLKVVLTISDKYWNFQMLNKGVKDDASDDMYFYGANDKDVFFGGGAIPALFTRESKMGRGNWKNTVNGLDHDDYPDADEAPYLDTSKSKYLAGESCLNQLTGTNKEILVDKFVGGSYRCATDNPASSFRFSVVGSNSNSRASRKYSATRWNPQIGGSITGTADSASIDMSRNIGHWFKFWEDLAVQIKDHPALYAVVTPESSIAGITHNKAQLKAVGYKGADKYYLWQIAQAKKIADAFSGVPVISSINWISEIHDTSTAGGIDDTIDTSKYSTGTFQTSFDTYQNRIGDAFQALNSGADTPLYGWWAQDLRLDKQYEHPDDGIKLRNVRSSYEHLVYPQFNKIQESSLKFTMVTGDTLKNSVFNSPANYAQELAELADSYEVGHIVFLDENIMKDGYASKKYAAGEVVSFINNITDKNSYSFLNTFDPVTTFSVNSSWVNTASGDAKVSRKIVMQVDSSIELDCSAPNVINSFSATIVEGNAEQPIGLKSEISCENTNGQKYKIFVDAKYNQIGTNTSKRKIDEGDEVYIKYEASDSAPILDQNGNTLESFEMKVST